MRNNKTGVNKNLSKMLIKIYQQMYYLLKVTFQISYFEEHISSQQRTITLHFFSVPLLLYPMICLIEVWIGSYPAKLAEDMSKIFSANMWSIC